MAIELKMPALSPTMEEGTLARWLKVEGDAIEPGDVGALSDQSDPQVLE